MTHDVMEKPRQLTFEWDSLGEGNKYFHIVPVINEEPIVCDDIAYCGFDTKGRRHSESCNADEFWHGEDVCEGCGMPVCPNCKMMIELDDMLDEK